MTPMHLNPALFPPLLANFAMIPPGALDWGAEGFSYAIQQAHLPGLIVSGILLVLSVVSWSVMFNKLAMTGKAARQNYRFIYAFRKSADAMELYQRKAGISGSPLYRVYHAACRELALHLIGTGDVDETTAARLNNAGAVSPAQMETVRLAMERATGEMVLFLEKRMNFLATAVSGAPFLGLLGTVWGVMEVFSRVASTGASASIKLMAPGVSAALVTTVIALLVAIPAMFGYNFIINKIRTLILEMHNFSAELGAILEREFVDYLGAPVVVQQPQQSAAVVQPQVEPQQFPQQPPQGVPTAQGGTHEAFPPPAKSQDGPPINPIAQQAARRTRRRPV